MVDRRWDACPPPRPIAARVLVTRPWLLGRLLVPCQWSQKTVIALVMQSSDNSADDLQPQARPLQVRDQSPRPRRAESDVDPGRQRGDATDGREAARHIRRRHVGDVFNIPLTAHYLGGCVISDDPTSGVIDPYHRVWNATFALRRRRCFSITANLGGEPVVVDQRQAERAACCGRTRARPTCVDQGAGGVRIDRSRLSRRSSPLMPGGLRLTITPGLRAPKAKAPERAAG